VPNLDDERFEIYLKTFRPVPPAPLSLPATAESHPRRTPRSITLLWEKVSWGKVLSALGAAAVVVAALFLLRLPGRQSDIPVRTSSPSAAAHVAPSQALTLRAANQLLASSPSFEAALDSLESEPEAAAIPKGKESALAVLSEENIKP
jgi:hypothetical protein